MTDKLTDNDRERIEQFFLSRIYYGLDGCWYWIGFTTQGYGSLRVKGRKFVKAHRFSFEYYKHPIPPGKLILHSCDNPRCVNPDHLSIGTHLDNSTDKIKKGRLKIFTGKRAVPRLTPYDVIKIRQMLANNTVNVVSKELNLNYETVRNIKYNKTWKKLKV